MMSEKEKEIEEEGILDHWSHEEHPLTLMEPHHGATCYCCGLHFRSGEQAYGCSKQRCAYTNLLHEECAEMPTKITHSIHQHTLIVQQAHSLRWWCRVCILGTRTSISYTCTISECKFEIHMRCARAFGTMEAADEYDGDGSCPILHHHPNYPTNHQLRFVEKRSSFKCDACGITGRGKSYICTSCGYWIHERCASLPQTIERPGDHLHSLSLSFRVPSQYLRYRYKCEVCNKALFFKYWIYHCQLCSFAVHINCAFKIKTTMKNVVTEKGVIRLPTNNVVEELIRPFVTGQGEAITPTIPPPHDEMANVKKYKFSLHEHQLSLISSSSSSSHHDQNKDSDTDDEEEYDWGKRPELMCDGCITPIFSSSSSSDKSSCYYYMSCGECSYNLHLACFDLPPRLPSLPVHNEPDDHELVLIESCDRLKPWGYGDLLIPCRVCGLTTNGLMYRCRKCSFVADIKCASLPHTVHHAAHPHRLLNLLTPGVTERDDLTWRKCAADCTSGLLLSYSFCYADADYEFIVHPHCALLPASTLSRRWDKKHRLVLTYDANLNHPGEFYCDECETEMNPKSWMYHCRHCDLSFHPRCFWTTSGRYRNFKLGQVCSVPEAHPHSLTYQLLTTKRRCDICQDNCYGSLGFRCAPCDFFICKRICGWEMDQAGQVQLVDGPKLPRS